MFLRLRLTGVVTWLGGGAEILQNLPEASRRSYERPTDDRPTIVNAVGEG